MASQESIHLQDLSTASANPNAPAIAGHETNNSSSKPVVTPTAAVAPRRSSEREGHHDMLEKLLRSKLNSDIHGVERQKLRNFLFHYISLKGKPGDEIFKEMVQYMRYKDPTEGSSWAESSPKLSSCSTTFSECLEILREELRSGRTESFQFCVLSAKLPEVTRSEKYSFSDKWPLARNSRLNRMYNAPRDAIFHVIRHQIWIDAEAPKPFWPNRKITLPSKDTTRKTPPVKDPESLIFKWQRVLPKYHNDLYEYIWQRQVEPPGYQSAKVSVHRISEKPKNALIIFDSTVVSEPRDEPSSILKMYKDILDRPLPHDTGCPHSIETQFVRSLYGIFRLMIECTKEFLTDLHKQLSDFTSLGRSDPSASKLHYLTHLEDCRQQSCLELADAFSLLSELWQTHVGKNTRLDLGMEPWKEEIEKDLTYLSEEMDGVKGKIEDVRVMVKDKLKLRQISRTFILTFVAAVYLPFSFMTSLFAMNVSDPLWPSSNSKASNGTASTTVDGTNSTSDVFAASQNETDAIVGAIYDTASHLWTFKEYWYVTASVTFATIFLPMIIGPIFRILSQFLSRHIAWWRAAILILGFNVIYFMSLYLPRLPFLIIFGVFLGLLAASLLIEALILKRRRILWASFALLYVATLASSIYFFSISRLSLGLVCPLFVFCVWVDFYKEAKTRLYVIFGFFGGEGTSSPETDLEAAQGVAVAAQGNGEDGIEEAAGGVPRTSGPDGRTPAG